MKKKTVIILLVAIILLAAVAFTMLKSKVARRRAREALVEFDANMAEMDRQLAQIDEAAARREAPTQKDDALYRRIASAFIEKAYQQKSLQIIDVGIQDNEIIVIFRDPGYRQANDFIDAISYLFGLIAGTIEGTALQDSIDRVVVVARLDDHAAAKVTSTVDNILAGGYGRITAEEYLDNVSIEPF